MLVFEDNKGRGESLVQFFRVLEELRKEIPSYFQKNRDNMDARNQTRCSVSDYKPYKATISS